MSIISTIALATVLGMALCAVQDYIESPNGPYRDPWRPQQRANQRIAQRVKPPSAFKKFIVGYWRELSIILGIVLAMIVIVWLAGCRMVAL